MKEGWKVKPLGDLCEVVGGGTPSKDKTAYYLGDIPWATVRDMRQDNITETEFCITEEAVRSSATNIIPSGNVVIATRVGLGKVCLLGQDTAINQDLRGIIPRDAKTLKVRYLYWWLKSVSDVIIAEGTGATVQGVKLPFIKSLPLPLPPLPEQERIVGILDEAFDGIAKAKATAEANLQNAPALFQNHLQTVFSQQGEGWTMERLDALTELSRGHNPPKSTFSHIPKNGYVRFYQIRDGASDNYAVYVPDSPKLHKMKKDDIMMVAYRHVGRAFRGVEGAFNVALCKISNARRDLLNDDYLFHLIPSQFVKGELLKRSERSLIPSMSIDHLRELEIPLPPLREQQKIVELITVLSCETQRLESLYQNKLNALDELKKSLLYQAFTGNL